jgi:2-oxoglutarate ferredoxin oxidoreductase subunit beta
MSCDLLHAAHEDERTFEMEDYNGPRARWCSGCGDHSVLTAAQKLMADEQLKPEDTVFVSGIGCSSRFPHYMKTYGFHGIHGRALTIATGVKLTRRDLNVFVVMGDGDCISIGAGHWIHAIRYNMNIVVMLFDNNIYGLTKKQTSPTTRAGTRTNTHPRGAWLPPLNPTEATLGFTNVSFVANTVDWNPAHLHATLHTAFRHPGLSFVHIRQRCPHFMGNVFEELVNDPSRILLLEHDDGIQVDPAVSRMYPNHAVHDPRDMNSALQIARREDVAAIGLLFQDTSRPCYEQFTEHGLGMTAEEKMAALDEELDRFAV